MLIRSASVVLLAAAAALAQPPGRAGAVSALGMARALHRTRG